MKRYLSVLLVLSLVLFPVIAQAAQFAVLGPRALGMGGASVAAVNDSTAVYWNPAALVNFRKVDIRIPAGVALRDYMNLSDNWDAIQAIYDGGVTPATADQLKQLLLGFDRPGSVTNIDVSGGFLVSFPVSSSGMAFSALGIGYGEIFPTVDTYHLNTGAPAAVDGIASNNTAVTAAGLVMAEPAVSFATSLGRSFLVGVNAKMVYASTFLQSERLRDGNFDTFTDAMNNSETKSNKASVDAGVLYLPTETLGIGVVGRYLNSPSFPVTGTVAVRQGNGDVTIPLLPVTSEIELKPQYRAGIAWKPSRNFTLSADYDLSKNKSFSERTEDQTIAGGAELTMFSEVLSLRAGAYKNTANDLANVVYTAGLGLRIFAFHIDVAGAYDFQEQEAQASASLALRF